jgi:hypothetical protein
MRRARVVGEGTCHADAFAEAKGLEARPHRSQSAKEGLSRKEEAG